MIKQKEIVLLTLKAFGQIYILISCRQIVGRKSLT